MYKHGVDNIEMTRVRNLFSEMLPKLLLGERFATSAKVRDELVQALALARQADQRVINAMNAMNEK